MAKTKAVLIIGASGFVGTHLALRLRDSHKVFATWFRRKNLIPGVTNLPFDIANEKWTKQVIYATEPDAVIYVAGDHEVDFYEEKGNDRASERIFAAGPLHSAAACHMMGSKYIYISSCHVYNGDRGNYRETDMVTPDMVFGKSKVGGENYVRGKSANWIMLRSSPLLGRGNGSHLSFMDKLRMALDRGQRFEVSNNHLYSFANVGGLAEAVARLVDGGMRNKVFHYGGLTKATWFEMSRMLATRFGYDPELIAPKRRKDGLSDEEARRDLSLNSSQLAEALKLQPLLLEESLDLIEKQLIPGL